jgi:hypothetical protein
LPVSLWGLFWRGGLVLSSKQPVRAGAEPGRAPLVLVNYVCPANHICRSIFNRSRGAIEDELTNQLDRIRGWEAEYSNESRFHGEYPCGGHAGLGHHRRAVGDQDLLRHVEQAGAAVGQTSVYRGSRRGLRSAAAEACCSLFCCLLGGDLCGPVPRMLSLRAIHYSRRSSVEKIAEKIFAVAASTMACKNH